jgi:hypothetical protein
MLSKPPLDFRLTFEMISNPYILPGARFLPQSAPYLRPISETCNLSGGQSNWSTSALNFPGIQWV